MVNERLEKTNSDLAKPVVTKKHKKKKKKQKNDSNDISTALHLGKRKWEAVEVEGAGAAAGSDACDQSTRKKKKSKKNRNQAESTAETHSSKVKEQKLAVENDTKTGVVDYPYDVNDDDHCETPFEAYRDISVILSQLATNLGKTKETLKIYDPYFCEGSVVQRLNSLGFMDVRNVKEDFYERINSGDMPKYDVIVTNPPYSDDHIERIFRFCGESSKPWFVLVPNYVYMKDYYIPAVTSVSVPATVAHNGKKPVNSNNTYNGSSSLQFPQTKKSSGSTDIYNSNSNSNSRGDHSVVKRLPFYVVPTKSRYQYTTPKRRSHHSGIALYKDNILTAVNIKYARTAAHGLKVTTVPVVATATLGEALPDAVVVRQVNNLPLEVCTDSDPRKKKERNAKKRDKHKARKKERQPQQQQT